MNLKIYSAAIIAATMMNACSSDEPNAIATDNGSDRFMAVSVNLPTTQGSRADNVSYDDGTAQEYKVENAMMLIFKKSGASELDYTYIECDALNGFSSWNADADAQITTKATAVARLTSSISVTNSDEYYAFVILNNPQTNGINLPAVGQKFGEWLNTPQSPAMGDVLYMASAPRYSANAMPLTLVKLDKSKIASSEATATEIGADIFVERGVAKVTVSSASMDNKNVAGATYAGDKVKINKWALDVTNKSTFPGRNLDGLTSSYADIWTNTGTSDPCTARFVGGNNTFKRVNWSKDPNYSKDITSQAAIDTDFNLLTDARLDASDNAGKALYCFENTFDIKHMMQGQTTRVVFKGVYTPAGMREGETFFRIGDQSTIWSATELTRLISSKANDVVGSAAAGATVNLSNDVLTKAGNHAITKDMITVGGSKVTDEQLAQIIALIGGDKGINTYLNGECYYVARIKHFGDAETPWNIGEPTYDNNNLKYLGRYSVVRNTWYELNVGSISNPGFAEIPVIDPTTPDDETDLYISVTVKVLPWAKRTQNVDL